MERDAFLGRLRRAAARPTRPPRIPMRELSGGVPDVVYTRAPQGVDGFVARWTALGGHIERGETGIQAAVAGRSPVVLAEDRPSRAALAAAAVGVIPAVCAIATTGSLVVDSSIVRSASLLPPVAVFVVGTGDVVDTPADVLRQRDRWWPDGLPSQIVLVSGPSRSGDIELVLTVGVHGPGEVHAVLVD